ncbi:MAG: CocE/NonD family hydrolase [Actinomycetota bacterium]
MRTVTDFPRAIREIRNVWIPMSDGTRLAARVWLPEDAESDPVPGVLEYIPYRKNDLTSVRDVPHYNYVAGHGYACVRVDLRGSGESEGVLRDEYLQQELDDGVEVIRWIAQQPWCSGKVGMIGISWGGFNGLQVAALQPPELGAVITLCSTDDRYADDVHHMGGCLLGDNLSWASTMFSHNSCPPDPEIVGDDWRKMWTERLEGSGLWLAEWLRHQRRDDYWRHGSVCEDYSAITCPVMAVSGWADGYSNAVFRLIENLSVPRRGLIGPWRHLYPHVGEPGPAIGFLQEEVRWWDHWLKGVDTAVDSDPLLTVWMQDSVPPTTDYELRPGRWIYETSWPSPNVGERVFALARGRLIDPDVGTESEPLTIQSPLSCGLFAGKWCSYGAPPDLPHDQREDDGGALVFETDPLTEELEILGPPTVDLEFTVDRPQAMVAVRLSDVLPDGRATRVTYGLLNLTHRNGAEDPEPLEPGQTYRVRVRMNDVAQDFPAGHRLRLSVSTVYWPLVWPSPEPVSLTIDPDSSTMTLPVRPRQACDPDASPFGPPEAGPPLERTILRGPEQSWNVVRDLVEDESRLEVVNDVGAYRIDAIDLEIETRAEETYTSRADDYESLRGETKWIRRFKRGDWEVRTIAHTVMTSDRDSFRIQAQLDAFEGDTRVHSQSWDERIERDHI